MNEGNTVAAPVSDTGSNTPASPSQGSGGSSMKEVTQAVTGSPDKSNDSYDVTVNGKTVKMTLQQLRDNASMSHAANDKFNEAKKTRSEVDKIISKAKTSPIEALMDPSLGLTKDQIRDAFEKWYHKEYIQPESLTPDQKRLMEYEEKIAKYEAGEKEKKELEEKEADEKLTANQRQYLQSQIIEALEKHNLPKTKNTVSRIAFYMRQNMQNGWDAPMDYIVRQVQNERQSSFKDEFSQSSAEQIISLFGDELINKIRSHDLQKLREKRQLPPVNSDKGPRGGGTGPMPGERVYSSDVAKRLRDIRTGKY